MLTINKLHPVSAINNAAKEQPSYNSRWEFFESTGTRSGRAR